MEFYQKLKNIRKEHGISQEELAARLNVSRQAVSKWESGQGFPETDKLIQLSTMFGISLDTLLKNESGTETSGEDGSFYASREAVEGFLIHRRSLSFRVAIGVAIIIMSIAIAMVTEHAMGTALMLIVAAIGACVLVMQGFQPKRYQEIAEKPLVFDESFIKEFRTKHTKRRWRCGLLIVCGIMLIILSFVLIMYFNSVPRFAEGRINAIAPIFWAVAVFLMIFAGLAIQSEGIIANNAAHMREVEKDRRSEPLFAAVLPLTGIIYVAIGLIWGAWHPGWLVFPIAVLICVAIAEIKIYRSK